MNSGRPDHRGTVSEMIISAQGIHSAGLEPPQVKLQTLVSELCDAIGFSTGIAAFAPGAALHYHMHQFSEAVTVLEGCATLLVQGRRYRLAPRDCAHIPAGVAHQVENNAQENPLLVHSAFASASPCRTKVDRIFPIDERGDESPSEGDPETITRFASSVIYELSNNALFTDLFARRFGAAGICGGYGRFLKGASLPCHTHDFDESITIVKGTAVCMVRGRRYELSNYDTAFVPRGVPHRFLNESFDEMAMVWVYAGDEPDRELVDPRLCSGALVWPEPINEIGSLDEPPTQS